MLPNLAHTEDCLQPKTFSYIPNQVGPTFGVPCSRKSFGAGHLKDEACPDVALPCSSWSSCPQRTALEPWRGAWLPGRVGFAELGSAAHPCSTGQVPQAAPFGKAQNLSGAGAERLFNLISRAKSSALAAQSPLGVKPRWLWEQTQQHCSI